MEFNTESRLEYPAQHVLEAMIHKMEELVPFMLTVKRIETVKFEQRDNGQIVIIRKWQGSKDSAPKAVRPFLSEEMLTWQDDAVWTPKEHKVDWSLGSSLGKLYDCSGTSIFQPHVDEEESATYINIKGNLKIYPEKVPGVPRFLARSLAPQIESFIVKMVQPNLTEVVKGLEKYLASKS